MTGGDPNFPSPCRPNTRPHGTGREAEIQRPDLVAQRRRCASAIRWRPSGVLGPALAPPWFGQRPPRPRPLRRQGCPARVLAPHGCLRSSRSRARSSLSLDRLAPRRTSPAFLAAPSALGDESSPRIRTFAHRYSVRARSFRLSSKTPSRARARLCVLRSKTPEIKFENLSDCGWTPTPRRATPHRCQGR